MNRMVLAFLMFPWMVGVPMAVSVQASCSSSSDSVRDALGERFRISRIDVQNPTTEGRIVKPAAVLVLRADGVSAKRLRAVQTNTKSPRFHLRDYARVELG